MSSSSGRPSAPEALAPIDYLAVDLRKTTYHNRNILRNNLPGHLAKLREVVDIDPGLEEAFEAVARRTLDFVDHLDHRGPMGRPDEPDVLQARHVAEAAIVELREHLLLAKPSAQARMLGLAWR